MITVKENLIAARALIDTPEKWGKGALYPKKNCFCAMGAVGAALGQSRVGLISDSQEYQALQLHLPRGFRGIPGFNDDPATTHADIMALFDRAIAAQDGKP